MPFARIKHPLRRALVASLVRIVAVKALFPVCPRPAPLVDGAAKHQQDAVEPFHNFRTGGFTPARGFVQDLPADLRVDGEKLGSCHV